MSGASLSPYQLLRPLLFSLPAESAHHIALKSLPMATALRRRPSANLPVTVMGIDFPNPLGIAAGLDKNGEHIDALQRLGCGFVEIGTVTPLAQDGNPKPRLFRLTDQSALINRMGFNNAGLDQLIANVAARRTDIVLGINIGKNRDTPLENAGDDYRKGLQAVYNHADYITINISSPNTPGLRKLQSAEYLDALLGGLKQQQQQLADSTQRYVPLAVKVAPDMSVEEVQQFCDVLVAHSIDAVIVGNTTLSRDGVGDSVHAKEQGGLSGAPLFDRTNKMIALFFEQLQAQIPIIGCGGIGSGQQASEHLRAGARLIQCYTGLIYRGPALVNDILSTLEKKQSG